MSAGIADLADGIKRIESADFDGRDVWIMPGLRDDVSDSVPDVMRGEETQLAALLATLDAGTTGMPAGHPQQVGHGARGAIQRIATAMTGRVVCRAAQAQHPRAPDADRGMRFDAYAFDAGLRRSEQPGGLLHHLFGVRIAGLFQQIAEPGLPSYLSGPADRP